MELVAGALGGNRSALSESELAELQGDSRNHCLGHVDDMQALMEPLTLLCCRPGVRGFPVPGSKRHYGAPDHHNGCAGCNDVSTGHFRSAGAAARFPAIELAVRLLIENLDVARRFASRTTESSCRIPGTFVNQSTAQYERLLEQPRPQVATEEVL